MDSGRRPMDVGHWVRLGSSGFSTGSLGFTGSRLHGSQVPPEINFWPPNIAHSRSRLPTGEPWRIGPPALTIGLWSVHGSSWIGSPPVLFLSLRQHLSQSLNLGLSDLSSHLSRLTLSLYHGRKTKKRKKSKREKEK